MATPAHGSAWYDIEAALSLQFPDHPDEVSSPTPATPTARNPWSDIDACLATLDASGGLSEALAEPLAGRQVTHQPSGLVVAHTRVTRKALHKALAYVFCKADTIAPTPTEAIAASTGETRDIVPCGHLASTFFDGQRTCVDAPIFVDLGLSEGLERISKLFDQFGPTHPELLACRDPEVSKPLRHFWAAKRHVTSKVSEAEQVGVSVFKLDSFRYRCAMAALVYERLEVVSMIRSIVGDIQATGGKLISFSWLFRYDEAPLKFRIADSSSLSLLGKRASHASAHKSRGVPSSFHDTVPHKVLQSQTGVAVFFERPTEHIGKSSFH